MNQDCVALSATCASLLAFVKVHTNTFCRSFRGFIKDEAPGILAGHEANFVCQV